jgi:uncharacterized protein DUF5996
MTQSLDATGAWPALPLAEWSDTCDTLHLWTQMAGKVKLALSPFQNHFWHVGLTLSPRGLTTGSILIPEGSFSIDFDFLDDRLIVAHSSGRTTTIPLAPQSVAAFYARFREALKSLGIEVTINSRPSEMAHPVPFEWDEQHGSYDAEYVRRWWRIQLRTERVLRRQSTRFVGKTSPVLLYWGSFDLAQALYSGRPAPWIEGVPRFVAVAEDRENMARGFWPGNTGMSGFTFGEPAYYFYSYPEPDGFKESQIPSARYIPELGQFILPYETMRTSTDPDQTLFDFLQATYDAVLDRGGWDRELLETRHPEALAH